MEEANRYIGEGIHIRVYGSGPPLVLIHPSPNSGKMFHGFASQLSKKYLVLCPDTPGYGESTREVSDNPTMTDYAKIFESFFNTIGLDKISIYGSATGAQLAIRYGILYPNKVEHLYLDNCAHFTDEERFRIFEEYFPDFTPKSDGSHITGIWNLVLNLFQYFPWCFQSREYKLSSPMPPVAILNAIALDFLVAGKNYDKAYRAAFEHEKVENIQKLKVPSTILRWHGSILAKYTDRIFNYDLPSNVGFEFISASTAKRYEEMYNIIANHSSKAEEQTLNTSILSPTISKQNETETLIKKLGDPPFPDISGNHLMSAWRTLKELRPDERPEKTQKKIIHWYGHQ